MNRPIKFQVTGDVVIFLSDIGNSKEFAELLSKALGAKPRKRRILIWVVRAEFIINEEVVPLFVDEDGSAHLEFLKTSKAVAQEVVRRLEQSPDFVRTD